MRYLQHYLADLDCNTILEESAYFDRDYLSDFAAFYSVSSRGYANRCRRYHFFSTHLRREHIRAAASGAKQALSRLQSAYLGFVVMRPIPGAPLGRTVLRSYPESDPANPRIVAPFREYEAHVAGFTLRVTGLAWQQQDAAVGACATVALWSLLHSSAFDDHHAIPTTADITRYAHKTASLGSRIFPSSGLTIYQLLEAIKEASLAPVVLQGDLTRDYADLPGFTPDRFAAVATTLIRSGYPALLVGELQYPSAGDEDEGGQATGGPQRHAVCAVGFRDAAGTVPPAGEVDLYDAAVKVMYVHDDNLGPAVRFALTTDPAGFVRLSPVAPVRRHQQQLGSDPTDGYPDFIPSQIVAAVHENLRTSPDALLERGIRIGGRISRAIKAVSDLGLSTGPIVGLTVSTRLMRLPYYLEHELPQLLGSDSRLLSRVRLELQEQVMPMSLHIGILRIGASTGPLCDVLYDTTDSDLNMEPFSTAFYDRNFHEYANVVSTLTTDSPLGQPIQAY